jgi:hypothetical protein
MGVNSNKGVISLPCSQNLGKYLRVKYDPTYGLALAGAGDHEIGLTADIYFAVAANAGSLGASVVCPVVPVNAQGIDYMVASGAFSAGSTVYGDANGQITGSANANPIGITLDTATAAGDQVRVVRVGAIATSVGSTTATSFVVAATGGGAAIGLDSNAATGAFTALLSPPNLTANRRWTGIDASDTIVFLAAAQTLTNKTLTGPTINGGTISGAAITLATVSVHTAACAATASTYTVLNTTADVTEIQGVTGEAAYGWIFGSAGTAGEVLTLIETAGYPGVLAPYAGGTINGLAANATITITAHHVYRCYCVAANTWFVHDAGALPQS